MLHLYLLRALLPEMELALIHLFELHPHAAILVIHFHRLLQGIRP